MHGYPTVEGKSTWGAPFMTGFIVMVFPLRREHLCQANSIPLIAKCAMNGAPIMSPAHTF